MEYSGHRGDTCTITLPKVQPILEGELERLYEPEVGENQRETVSSRQGRATVGINSQSLGSPIEGLHKIRTVGTSTPTKEGLLGAHPRMKSYWQFMASREGRVSSL